MAKPINHERSKTVVHLRDKKGLSWRKIGKVFNLAASTVFEIYHNEKERSGLTTNKKAAGI